MFYMGFDVYKGDLLMMLVFFVLVMFLSLMFVIFGFYRREYRG